MRRIICAFLILRFSPFCALLCRWLAYDVHHVTKGLGKNKPPLCAVLLEALKKIGRDQ